MSCRIVDLEKDIERLERELDARKKESLRTYGGLSEKANKYAALANKYDALADKYVETREALNSQSEETVKMNAMIQEFFILDAKMREINHHQDKSGILLSEGIDWQEEFFKTMYKVKTIWKSSNQALAEDN